MRELSVFVSAILIVFAANGQREKVRQVELQGKEYTVILETERAKIYFNIDDLRAEWERIKEVLKSRGDRYNNGVKAMEWLNSQRGMVQIIEAFDKENTQSVEALNLVMTITHSLGARLVRDGKTRIYRKDKAMYQPEYEYKLLSTAEWSDVYGFYFTVGHDMFLKGEVVGEYGMHAPEEKKEDDEGIFTIVEVSPEFPGGLLKFQEYVKKNARFSAEAKKSKTSGKVFVSFIVLKDGMVDDIKIQKGINAEFDQEAVRLIREAGKWKPGTQNGKIVNARYTLPIALDASGI